MFKRDDHTRDDHTERLLETSDKIAQINRRILERAKKGQPRCEDDHRLITQLMADLNRPRGASAERV